MVWPTSVVEPGAGANGRHRRARGRLGPGATEQPPREGAAGGPLGERTRASVVRPGVATPGRAASLAAHPEPAVSRAVGRPDEALPAGPTPTGPKDERGTVGGQGDDPGAAVAGPGAALGPPSGHLGPSVLGRLGRVPSDRSQARRGAPGSVLRQAGQTGKAGQPTHERSAAATVATAVPDPRTAVPVRPTADGRHQPAGARRLCRGRPGSGAEWPAAVHQRSPIRRQGTIAGERSRQHGAREQPAPSGAARPSMDLRLPRLRWTSGFGWTTTVASEGQSRTRCLVVRRRGGRRTVSRRPPPRLAAAARSSRSRCLPTWPPTFAGQPTGRRLTIARCSLGAWSAPCRPMTTTATRRRPGSVSS